MKLSAILKNEKVSLALILLGGGFLILLIIPFLWNEFPLKTSAKLNSEKLGQFGDIIGGVIGSMWALAGVILFYIALTEQRKDFARNQQSLTLQVESLNQQIEGFKLQQEEIEFTRKNYEEQSRMLRIQQFESNFYSMLNVYLTIKENLNAIDDQKDYFKSIYQSMIDNCDQHEDLDTNHAKMVHNYINFFSINSGHLSHYFKSFYRIMKVIDTHISLSEEDKLFYAKILRSQLTDYEQLLLFYNAYTIYGEKARPLILKYNLIKHLPFFKKPPFANTHSIQKDNNILLFSEWLTRFLVNYLNDFYEIDLEVEKYEETCIYLDCIVGIYFNEAIDIKVYCSRNLVENGVNLSETDFSNFILNFLYEKIVLSTYLDSKKIGLKKYKTETDNHLIFGVEVSSQVSIKLSNN